MSSHENFKAREKQLAKKAIRKEVRDICKTIEENPNIMESDDFFHSHLGWEAKQITRR
jgi:hypothetical protein